MDNGVRCLFDDFMRSLQGCDTVTVGLKGVGETTYTTREIYEAIDFRGSHRSPKPEALMCEGCAHKGMRHQKCTCCKRNVSLKDCYATKPETEGTP